jgi:GxxExxY protein
MQPNEINECSGHRVSLTSCATGGITVETQVALPSRYRGVQFEVGYRIDMIVNDVVVVELKAVSRLLAIHEPQLLSHLRLSHRRVGLLINFHVPRLRDGIKRMIVD